MRADGLCGSITCDAEYPPRVAFSLLTRLLEDFSAFKPDWARESRNESVAWPQLESDVVKYQDPANADQIMKIQRSLDETRDVLHNTIGRYTYRNVTVRASSSDPACLTRLLATPVVLNTPHFPSHIMPSRQRAAARREAGGPGGALGGAQRAEQALLQGGQARQQLLRRGVGSVGEVVPVG